ncbi:MAG: hypothetical protein WC412_04675 [Candidatus Omnitrophota bacterium]|jgi:type II secretory pathway pseudopilin PulG
MKAFTLVEVLVSAAILVIILGSIVSVFLVFQRTFQEDMGLLDLQQEARMVMDGMIRELRQSADVNLTSTTDLSFKIPRSTGVTVNLYDPSTYYQIRYYFDADGHEIKREYPVGTTQIIASNIEQLNFALLGDVLQVKLRMNKSVFMRQLQFPLENLDTAFTDCLTGNVRLRNKYE